jgi:uncharacterized protein (TIGR01244 family)
MAGMHKRLLARLLLVPTLIVGLSAATAAAQAPAPRASADPSARNTESVAGVRNYTRVDSTFACGGALSPEAYAAIKEAGFRSIVNLRLASEPGANVDDGQKLALAAGLKYIHLPFSTASPDASQLDQFLKVVADKQNQPVLLHCASGGRASMFWAAKRVMVDGWTVERAMGELPELSRNVAEPLRAFVLDYLASHGKTR